MSDLLTKYLATDRGSTTADKIRSALYETLSSPVVADLIFDEDVVHVLRLAIEQNHARAVAREAEP